MAPARRPRALAGHRLADADQGQAEPAPHAGRWLVPALPGANLALDGCLVKQLALVGTDEGAPNVLGATAGGIHCHIEPFLL
jgi:hypothetical protein